MFVRKMRRPKALSSFSRRLIFLAIAFCCCAVIALRAQTSSSVEDGTSTTEIQGGSVNPTRSVESHSHSGNRTKDNRSIQRRGSDGSFEPYQDIEKETVQVNATTVRTTTRTFGRDSNGAKTLVQVSEEEQKTFPGGGSSLERSVSNPDANGRLQLVQRQVKETKQISKDVAETKTTVMLPDINGGLAPAMQVHERRRRGADDTVDSQKTTLLPDGNGNWRVGETRHETIRQDGKNRSTEESVSRADADGKLEEVSRTVSRESEAAPGEKRSTVETYSVDLPGTARDGSLHPVERKTTLHRTSATGKQTTEKRVEQPVPGVVNSDLQVTTVAIDTVNPGSSGTRGSSTVQTRDANGGFGVVSVDTTQSDTHSVQVQIAPTEKPK